jgi:hypothetical protein
MHNSRNVVNLYAKKTLVTMAAKLTHFINIGRNEDGKEDGNTPTTATRE